MNGGTPPALVAVTTPEATPLELALTTNGDGLTPIVGWAGAAKPTETLDTAVLPAASVTVTFQVSVKLSPQPSVALIDGCATVALETELREPDVRCQL